MYVAIMGFGHNPPTKNLKWTAKACRLIAESGHGIAVGNVTGTFAIALQAGEKAGAPLLAVIDPSMDKLPRPLSTEAIVVEANQKHKQIAERAGAGLIVGGGPGTIRLANQFLDKHKPLAAVTGSGGVVDDQSLPTTISRFLTVEDTIKFLLEKS